ncbi:hypothetical protein BJ878DRAFT_536996 [Calycina marina]|uniref:COP9 signalosome complex subunit 6 n=1 Tax=Calycina marina TaxID=1763456 RepID=A0A9P7YVB3_9HELO|nr:hypothetical protein BJ878DRAFT_536996 [Calycina marina]
MAVHLHSYQKADSGLQLALHPLALLTISDYITRHTLRNQKGPVVGALLGQQDGRQITIEHTFDVHMINVDGQQKIHQSWFEDRLQAMKDVHKSPALDFVGWWTVMPTEGPQPVHVPLHRDFLDYYNESAILLGFHPSDVLDGTVGGKLPITIYESNFEAESTPTDNGEDEEMKDAESSLVLKFKELSYTVESGEAEMISVAYIARGGGNATAVELPAQKGNEEGKSGKGATRPQEKSDTSEIDPAKSSLTSTEEEKIAALVAKANAVKMLRSRIDLIIQYLQNLPPYVDPTIEGKTKEGKEYMPVDPSLLRSIYALLSRLSLIVPSGGFAAELLSERNDVSLISMLSSLTASVKEIRETGKKFAAVENGRHKTKGGDKGSFETRSLYESDARYLDMTP